MVRTLQEQFNIVDILAFTGIYHDFKFEHTIVVKSYLLCEYGVATSVCS